MLTCEDVNAVVSELALIHCDDDLVWIKIPEGDGLKKTKNLNLDLNQNLLMIVLISKIYICPHLISLICQTCLHLFDTKYMCTIKQKWRKLKSLILIYASSECNYLQKVYDLHFLISLNFSYSDITGDMAISARVVIHALFKRIIVIKCC